MPAQLFAAPVYVQASFGHVVVAELAGVGDGVETPAEFAGVDVEGADVASGRGKRFGSPATDDQQVLIYDTGTGEHDGLLLGIAAQAFAQSRCARRRQNRESACLYAHPTRR